MGMKYTPEMLEFLSANIKGVSYVTVTDLFNERFHTSTTVTQIKGLLSRKKLTNGIDGKFSKGQIPHNKGKKGVRYKGSERTWFKKRHRPKNHRPVGSERISKDGYIEIKVSEPNKWSQKHVVIWEKVHGKTPEGYVIIFLDQNKENCELENLKLISRAELLVMNREKLFSCSAQITEVGTTLSKMVVATQEKKKEVNPCQTKQKRPDVITIGARQ